MSKKIKCHCTTENYCLTNSCTDQTLQLNAFHRHGKTPVKLETDGGQHVNLALFTFCLTRQSGVTNPRAPDNLHFLFLHRIAPNVQFDRRAFREKAFVPNFGWVYVYACSQTDRQTDGQGFDKSWFLRGRCWGFLSVFGFEEWPREGVQNYLDFFLPI